MKKSIFRYVTMCTSLLIVMGCAVTPKSTPPTVKQVSRPSIGTVNKAQVGDSLIEQSTLSMNQGIQITTKTECKGLGVNVLLEEGDIFGRYTHTDGLTYCGLVKLVGMAGNVVNYRACLTNKNDARWEVAGMECPPMQVAYGEFIQDNQNNRKRQITYQGKSKSNIFLNYQEFNGNLKRATDEQSLTFDLDDGNEIGIKDARLLILNATNTEITFKVVKQFGSLP